MRELAKGNIPRVQSSIMIPASEIAHIEASATYVRQLTASVKHHNGLLVITNARIIFTHSDHPFEVALSKVVGVAFYPPRRLELNLTRRQGSGFYESQNAVYIVEILRAALNLRNRHTVVQKSGSRSIPQDVKTAVWARDGGRCVQCNEAQYLEFDHLIPFSKGGATSVANLQLLCRRCNLAKRDNI